MSDSKTLATLAAMWRKSAALPTSMTAAHAYQVCADDLEAALAQPTLGDLYCMLRRQAEDRAFATYCSASFDAGWLGALAAGLKANLDDDDLAQAEAFDAQLLNERVQRAAEAK